MCENPAGSWLVAGLRRIAVPAAVALTNYAGTAPIPPGPGNPLGRAGLLRPLPCDLGDALQQWAFCSLRRSPGAWGDVEWQVAR